MRRIQPPPGYNFLSEMNHRMISSVINVASNAGRKGSLISFPGELVKTGLDHGSVVHRILEFKVLVPLCGASL